MGNYVLQQILRPEESSLRINLRMAFHAAGGID